MRDEIDSKTPQKITNGKPTRVRGHSFADRAAAAAVVGHGPRGGRPCIFDSNIRTGGFPTMTIATATTKNSNSNFVMMAASHLADDPFVGNTRAPKKKNESIAAGHKKNIDIDVAGWDDDETEDEYDDDSSDFDEDGTEKEDDEMEDGAIEADSDDETILEAEMDMDVDVECQMVQEGMLPLDYGICWKCGGLKETLKLQKKYCL